MKALILVADDDGKIVETQMKPDGSYTFPCNITLQAGQFVYVCISVTAIAPSDMLLTDVTVRT